MVAPRTFYPESWIIYRRFERRSGGLGRRGPRSRALPCHDARLPHKRQVLAPHAQLIAGDRERGDEEASDPERAAWDITQNNRYGSAGCAEVGSRGLMV